MKVDRSRSSRRRESLLFVVAFILLASGDSRADAIVRSQAMHASTIAEFFVTKERVVVELEIGSADFEAFRPLLPETIPEGDFRPLSPPSAKRLEDFFERVLPIRPDGGAPLVGRVTEMESRGRTRRDDITGETLPTVEGEKPQPAVWARLEYPLTRPPATLDFSAPPGGTVGFVVYHEGIAVNDFRYLGYSQPLHLDWADPWFSRFKSRSLRRKYFAPMSGFIYIDPYEVRKEIIARPVDLQSWVDLGLDGRETIPVEIQADLKRKVAAFLREHHPVVIDGVSIEPELARINFLERTLRTSRVVDPPRELDIHAAVLGVIFAYTIDGLPDHVEMDWDLWNDRLDQVPAASIDQAGPMPIFLSRDWRVLEWQNFLQNPQLPTLQTLEVPPSGGMRVFSKARWLLTIAALLCVVRAARGRRRMLVAIAVVAILLSLASFRANWQSGVSERRARELVSGLLHNVYRAFDYRDESRIYDVLALSAEGDLLEQVFLETRRGLELQSQGGARAKVKEIELIDLEIDSVDGGAFNATVSWNVAGAVGHWGHIHERRNRYRARLGVAPIDGAWKLVRVDVLEEERL